MSRLQVGICSSLTASVLQKLRSAGVRTVINFVTQDLDGLAAKSGVSYRELASIRRLLIAEHAAPVVNGAVLFDIVVGATSVVSVGCQQLDDMLDGGFMTGEITEVVTGSNTTSNAVILNTIRTVVSTMNKNVVYIDTANHFSATELFTLSETSAQHLEQALTRVRVLKCFDIFELLCELNSLSEALIASTDLFYTSLKLVVIDGIADCILPALSNLQSDAGCGYVAQLARQLQLLATDFALAVVMCNACENSRTMSSVARLPTIRQLWSSVADTRLLISDIANETTMDGSGLGGRIKVTLSKCKRQPEGQCLELQVDEQERFM